MATENPTLPRGFAPRGSRPWPTNEDGSPTQTGRIIRLAWGAGILIALIAVVVFVFV